MAKRFADTRLFEQSWFVDLSYESKLIWFYLTGNCDHAGIWEIDIPRMRRCLGCKTLNLVSFMDEVNRDYSKITGDPVVVNRVVPVCNNTKLWLTGFVSEQYEKGQNGINTSVPAIKSVVNRLKDEGVLHFALKEGFIRIQKQKQDPDELQLDVLPSSGNEQVRPESSGLDFSKHSSATINSFANDEKAPLSQKNDSSSTIIFSEKNDNSVQKLKNNSNATINLLSENKTALKSPENDSSATIFSSEQNDPILETTLKGNDAAKSPSELSSPATSSLLTDSSESIFSFTGGKSDKEEKPDTSDKSHPLNTAAKGSEPFERDKDKDKDEDMRSSSSGGNVLKEIGGAGERTNDPPSESLHDEQNPPKEIQETGIIPETLSRDYSSLPLKENTSHIDELFQTHWGKRLHTQHEELLTAQLILDYGLEEVTTAFGEAVNHNRPTLAYIKGILQKRRVKLELQKAEEAKKAELQRQAEKAAEERRKGIKLGLIESVYGTR